jgi:hypothetical protein
MTTPVPRADRSPVSDAAVRRRRPLVNNRIALSPCRGPGGQQVTASWQVVVRFRSSAAAIIVSWPGAPGPVIITWAPTRGDRTRAGRARRSTPALRAVRASSTSHPGKLDGVANSGSSGKLEERIAQLSEHVMTQTSQNDARVSTPGAVRAAEVAAARPHGPHRPDRASRVERGTADGLATGSGRDTPVAPGPGLFDAKLPLPRRESDGLTDPHYGMTADRPVFNLPRCLRSGCRSLSLSLAI